MLNKRLNEMRKFKTKKIDERIKYNQARIHEILKKAVLTKQGKSDLQVLSVARESVKQL